MLTVSVVPSTIVSTPPVRHQYPTQSRPVSAAGSRQSPRNPSLPQAIVVPRPVPPIGAKVHEPTVPDNNTGEATEDVEKTPDKDTKANEKREKRLRGIICCLLVGFLLASAIAIATTVLAALQLSKPENLGKTHRVMT